MRQPMNQRGSAAGVTLAVIAIIISVLALVLGWIAYNRTGADLENRIQEGINQSAQEVQEQTEQGAQEAQEGINEGAQEVEDETDGVNDDDTNQTPSNDDSTETPTQ